MSSKSRNRSRPKASAKKSPTHHKGAAKPHEQGAKGESSSDMDLYARAGADEEEFVRVPKHKSKFKYYLTLGIILFTLLTFMTPLAVQQAAAIWKKDLYLAWTTPDGDRIEYTSIDWNREKEGFDNALGLLAGAQRTRRNDIHFATYAIYDRLAIDAGIEVGADEISDLLDVLATAYGGQTNLRARIRQYRMSERGFRETLTRLVRASRYQNILGEVAALPDTAEIERLYQEQHREYRFDTVSVEVADYADAAAQALPETADLEAWFDALGEAGQGRFLAPATVTAELFGYIVGGEAPQALLDAYPEPAGVGLEGAQDAEQRARAYYDQNRFQRFRREEPLMPEDVPEEIEDPQERSDYTQFVPYDEVADACRVEADVLDALGRWRTDLVARLEGPAPEEAPSEQESGDSQSGDDQAGDDQMGGGESAPGPVVEIDVAAEAKALGLDSLADGEARSREDWAGLEDWGGSMLQSRLFLPAVGQLTEPVTVLPGALVVGRVVAKAEAAVPPFEEIVPEVEEAWAEERQRELAEETLAALRKSLAGEDAPDELLEDPVVDAEAFAAAAAAAGLTPVQVDWFDRMAPFPPPTEEGVEPSPEERAMRFVRMQGQLFTASEGAVPPPATDFASETWYLVRAAGERDGDLSKMGPGDYTSLRDQSAFQRRQEFLTEAFGGMFPDFPDWESQSIELRNQFDLYLYPESEEARLRAEELAEERAKEEAEADAEERADEGNGDG